MYQIKELQLEDSNNMIIFEMLQHIGSNENEFKNPMCGANHNQYREWILEQVKWAQGIALPEGYVPQTIYWFYYEDKPIGVGKIRQGLSAQSRVIGGNIGYAIDGRYRGNGYATNFLPLLIEEAYNKKVDELLLTVEKYNLASRKVIENCGGKLLKATEERWYFTFDRRD